MIAPPTYGGGSATAALVASALSSPGDSEEAGFEPRTQSSPAAQSPRLSSVTSSRSDAALLAWLPLKPGAAQAPSAALIDSHGEGSWADDPATADAADRRLGAI